MSTWAARAKAAISQKCQGGTAKTDETPVFGLSSVSSVPTEAQKPQRPQSCDSCAHISKARTCLEPVAAGVAEHFHIVWCDLLNGHGRRCTAYAPKDHK